MTPGRGTIDATLRGEGVRGPWSTVPVGVIAAVEDRLGAHIVGADDRRGGFSPGPAAVLTLGDGRRAFAKAADGAATPASAGIHRREAVVAGWLPETVPAPRLLGCVDRGDWIVVLFEAVEGRSPVLPWVGPELSAVLRLAEAVSAVALPPDGPLAPSPEAVGRLFGGWAEALQDPPPGLDAWSRHHLGVLVEVERRSAAACAGRTLVHGDLRADNVLVALDGAAVLVDWPHASVGAPWLDVALATPSIAMQGGPEPEVLVRRSPLLGAADPQDLTALVVGFAGYLTIRALQPAPPGLPTLRRFQAEQGRVARGWAAERLGLA